MKIQSIFKRLLVDLSDKTGIFIDSPDDLDSQWLLSEAPALCKELLSWIEQSGHRHLPLAADCEQGDFNLPIVPDWLWPVLQKFLVSNEAFYLSVLNQILAFCYKIEYEPTNHQVLEACKGFKDTEASIGVWANRPKDDRPVFWARTRHYVSQIVYKANWQEIIPSHGPGAVFPTARPHARSYFLSEYESITKHYPIDRYYAPLPNSWDELLVAPSKFMDRKARDIVARLCFVPKDSRGPRTICVHPPEAIWIQQGLRRELERQVKRSNYRGFINFDDQTVNQLLAKQGSSDGSFATIDLKDASDRLHCDLIRELFGEYAYEILSCCRASHVIIGDDMVELKKWAPMGNCLTFPVESIVFFSLVRAGIDCKFGIREGAEAAVFVYGDDIIVPAKYYACALQSLVAAGLIPNASKCYSRGSYRESCGVEAYRGFDITPSRLRISDVASAKNAISACSLALRLRIKGLERTAAYIYSIVSKCWGILPKSNNPDTQGLFEYVESDLLALLTRGTGSIRWSQNLHRWEVKVRQLRAAIDSRPKDGWNHLLDGLLALNGRSELSNMPLEYPVPYRERLTYGWTELLVK